MTMEWDLINALEKSKNMRVSILFQIVKSLLKVRLLQLSYIKRPTKEELELENTLQFQSNFYHLQQHCINCMGLN